jgi:hypothetical protein
MNGKILDAAAILLVAVLFLGFAIFAPGIGNLLVAILGVLGLGYYNSFVRRRHGDLTLRDPWV